MSEVFSRNGEGATFATHVKTGSKRAQDAPQLLSSPSAQRHREFIEQARQQILGLGEKLGYDNQKVGTRQTSCSSACLPRPRRCPPTSERPAGRSRGRLGPFLVRGCVYGGAGTDHARSVIAC